MKKVLIHIGLHKTGTTWLQNELFISENNVFEPLYESNTLRGHSTLAEDFIFDQNRNLLNSCDNNIQSIKQSLQSILDKKTELNKIFVMSHERLSGHPSSSAFDSSIIARRIKNIFPNGKILIVIREQVSCILSNYFQYLKEGGTLDLTNYLNSKYDARRPGFSENYFKYHHLISHYQKEFGQENVLVLTSELFNSDKVRFFNILSKHLGAEIAIDSDNFKKEYNIKKNHYVNYKFRFLNNYIKSSSSLNNSSGVRFQITKNLAQKLKKTLSFLATERMDVSIKKELKNKIYEWSIGKFEESNEISNSLIDLNLNEFGYTSTTSNRT